MAMKQAELEALVASLTLTEKIGQLVQLSGDFFHKDAAMLVGPQSKLGINEDVVDVVGSVLNVTGADKVRDIQQAYLEKSRHKIPLLFMSDIIYGYRTVYPIPLGFSTSWDPALIEQGYEKIAEEAVAAGAHVTFAPMVDLVKDPRWGRCLESLGEDTYLSSQYSAAMVRGLQKDLNEGRGIASCVKHFAAYGAGEGGRDYNTVDMSERRLRQEYLPAYKAAIDAGCELVMTSFNTVDGIPATGNKWLLKDILRDEWQFNGVVISDYAAVQELIPHGYALDEADATLKAIEATNDIDMKTACYANELAPLVAAGKVDMAQIDAAVLRVLELKNKLGLFEDPYRGVSSEKEAAALFTPEHRALAREIAENSLVLLQNKNNVLPLRRDQKIALIGPYGDSKELMGLWAVHGQTDDVTTLKEALEAKVGEDAIRYTKGCDMLEDYSFLGEFGIPTQMIDQYQLTPAQKEAEKAQAFSIAKESDVIVLALGEHTLQSGEAGSRTSLRLPEKQRELLQELTTLGKPIVLISFSGRPLVLTDELDLADGIIQAWFPGTEGAAALANILYGTVNPSARLTQSFPYNEGQIPVYYNHFNTGRPENSANHSGRFVSKYLDAPNQPLYPFGYGLSYHEASYGPITLSESVLTAAGTLEASLEVTNTSDIAGSEVVQLYLRDLQGSVVRPVKELKGFQKITLAPHETQTVRFTITEEMLRFVTRDLSYASEAGEFELFIGKNSEDVQQASFTFLNDTKK